MDEIITALTDYVRVLHGSAAGTARAEDRGKYTRHLAAAALMYMHALSNDRDGLESVVSSERRAYGWDYLEGSEGAAAEGAFARLSALIEAL